MLRGVAVAFLAIVSVHGVSRHSTEQEANPVGQGVALAAAAGLAAAHANTQQSEEKVERSAEHGKQLSRTAFIVRASTADKDVAMMDRVAEWAHELRQTAPEVDFWVSLDVTDGSEHFTAKDWSKVPAQGNVIQSLGPEETLKLNVVEGPAVEKVKSIAARFQQKNLPVKLHLYSEKDILDVYPKVEEARSRADEACDGKNWCKKPLGWQFHSEAVGLWWKHNQNMYDYVWVTEPDMDFHGKIADTVESYVTWRPMKEADLLLMTLPAYPPQWMWEKTGSLAFNEKTNPLHEHLMNQGMSLFKTDSQHTDSVWQNGGSVKSASSEKCPRLAAPEYLQRFSSKMLHKMTAWCMEQGRCAHSEQFAPTVANCEGLNVKSMDARLLQYLKHNGGPLR